MNWFQIVFLREDSQDALQKEPWCLCCELISNCIFTWGFTSNYRFHFIIYLLWIDFKLYFYVRIHKYASEDVSPASVVNWFQIVFLREDSQEKKNLKGNGFSCELISNCIFTWGFTSFIFLHRDEELLWIDFKLYFYVRIHKWSHWACLWWLVVNWFQIVFLREDSQAILTHLPSTFCCELISNCIFTWGFTRTPWEIM